MDERSQPTTRLGLARMGHSRHRLIIGALMGATAIVALPLLGMADGSNDNAAESGTVQTAALPAPLTEGFSVLVEAVSPAVVNIATTGRSSGREMRRMPNFEMPDLPENSPFREYFKKFFEQQSERDHDKRRRAERTRSLGSGFIVDSSGYVVTNNHVIDGADDIEVTLSDGRTFDAAVIGRDPDTDIAVLKFDGAEDLPTITWGDSDSAKVGDWVVAVGNPFGLGGSVTAGIISARGRNIQAGPYDDFLQIDASINRGNSGGPAFNAKGEVIGINTAIYSPSGGNVGIGFTIPAALAKPVVDQLREHGEVQRGWLGVYIQDLTPELAEGLGLEEDEGALVSSVIPDSPAEKAGLAVGDVIVEFAGEEIEDAHELPRVVADTTVGQTTELEVLRDGERQAVSVEIAERAADFGQDAAVQQSSKAEGTLMSELGMEVAKITPALRERYELTDAAEGVVVTGVDQDGIAAERGIREGDVIVRVGQENVASPSDVESELAKAKDAGRDSIATLVKRGERERFVALAVPAA